MKTKEKSKIYKILAGVITAMIALTLLLIIVIEAVAKAIALIMFIGMAGFLFVGIWWLILQILEGKPCKYPPR